MFFRCAFRLVVGLTAAVVAGVLSRVVWIFTPYCRLPRLVITALDMLVIFAARHDRRDPAYA